MCVGALMSTVLSIYQEKLARHYGTNLHHSEGRLYFACIESALLPIGLFWFGWTFFASTHWIVHTLAVGCATMGIFSVYLAVFNYLADTYHRYASSALAAQSFCRNTLGGIFPLVIDAMFTKMTFAGAASFLGGVGVVLTIVSWVLVVLWANDSCTKQVREYEQPWNDVELGEGVLMVIENHELRPAYRFCMLCYQEISVTCAVRSLPKVTSAPPWDSHGGLGSKPRPNNLDAFGLSIITSW